MLSAVEGRMVVGKVVPGSVQVVGHDVDKVQLLGNSLDIIPLVHTELGGRHGS